MKVNQVILSFFAIVTVTVALYADDSAVFKLTEGNFKKEVLETDDIWLVEFYGIISCYVSTLVWSL